MSGIPITGKARGSAGAAFEIAKRRGALRLDFLRDYLIELYRVAGEVGIDADVLVSQADLETGAFTSFYYVHDGNVAGFGAFDDGSNLGLQYGAQKAARGHVAHMAAYVGLTDIPIAYIQSDPRWGAVFDAGYAGTVTTTADLGKGRWATDPEYPSKLLSRYRAYWGEPVTSQTEGTQMAQKPYVLITSGHRSTGDPGNPGEKDITDEMSRATIAELRRRGYECNWWQAELDGDDLPDQTRGDLSTVATGVRNALRAWLTKHPGRLAVLIDEHFDGWEAPVHCVAPDVTGLASGYGDGAPANDTLANNELDRRLGGMIAQKIVAAIPGMRLYGGSGSPQTLGVMSERTTYVGGQGWRLGMFGATAIVRDRCVRLVVEHGGVNDFSRYPNFAARCAAAKVDALDAIFGAGTGVVPDTFAKGDTITVTRYHHLNASPDGPETLYLPPGAVGTIIAEDGPKFDKYGTPWWNTQWDKRYGGGGTGYLPENALAKGTGTPPPAHKAVVFRYPLPVRSTAGFNGPILKELPAGTQGAVVAGPETADGIEWYRVEVPGFGDGWVPASIIRTLEIKEAA